ncbi:MAG TPA: hypothetical protein PKB06_11230, partial [Actinotalea sp.]|nr:hypothetical protein [Actinotalea sp.]
VRGHTIKGTFAPATRELRVLSRPWAGQVFSTPAAAGRALDAYFGHRGTTRWRLADGGVLRASVLPGDRDLVRA